MKYLFIAEVSESEMRHIIDRDIAEQSTPQFNNSQSAKTKSTLHKKIIFQDAVAPPPHISFRILSHQIAPDSTSNGCNSTGRQVTSNRKLKRCLVTLSSEKNYSNAIEVGRAANALIQVIHGIKVDANKVKIAPYKSKQPNLEVL